MQPSVKQEKGQRQTLEAAGHFASAVREQGVINTCSAHGLLSTQPRTLPRGVGQPTLRMCLPISIAQRFVSMVTPNPIKLPMNIHHHNCQGNRHFLGLLSVCRDLFLPLGKQSLLFPNQKCSLSRLVLSLSLQTLQCSWFQTYLHLELCLFKDRWQDPRPDLAYGKDSLSPAPQDALEWFWADLPMLQN